MSDKQKYLQIRREAGFTGLALLALILFWLAAGFGTASLDVKIMHLPLWALLGSFGVWAAAIVLTFLLTKFVFKDMDFDDQTEARLDDPIDAQSDARFNDQSDDPIDARLDEETPRGAIAKGGGVDD